uniref:NADH-ubiquinone oxidoreductase chain 5 n=1 Tax=Lampsilis siliquoidea TaxID=52396 RepID=A0A4Y1KQ83_LAMSI|nr:NADH dehydrogenase subunit 5 [Lampsilis siliquoidea]
MLWNKVNSEVGHYHSISLLGWGVFFLVMSLLLMIMMFGRLVLGNSDLVIIEWEFFGLLGLWCMVLIVFDLFSVLFSSLVCLIGGCVFIFSVSYMGEDKCINSFSYLTVSFVLAMNVLIFIPYLVFLLIGWDLLGVVSFLLVIHYQGKSCVSVGMITVLINRVGDVFLLVSVGLSLELVGWGGSGDGTGSLKVNSLVSMMSVSLVMASMTKSAQFPFSVWLPAAMAAPTPISALVHSSTLVVAGVYLLFRYYPLLSVVDGLLLVLSKIGCLTLLMASFVSCFEFDIKKLVALSTLSHLGFMVYVLGLGYPVFSVFHMLSHAVFKSLLFLCVGFYTHYSGFYLQDTRQLCGIGWASSPVLTSCSVVGFSSLCGLPYLGGFYSKHVILESSILTFGGVFELLILVVGAVVSCFYSTWVLLWVVFGVCGGGYSRFMSCSSWSMVSIYLLAVYSVFFGYFSQSILVESCDVFITSFSSKMILFLMTSVSGAVSAVYWFAVGVNKNYCVSYSLNNFYLFLSSMWFLKYLFGYVPSFWLEGSMKSVQVLELGWVEMLNNVFSSFSVLSVWVWVLERVSILVLVRFGLVVVFLCFFCLNLYKKIF